MIAILRRAAVLAVFVQALAISAQAQQPDQGTLANNDYLPPARFIAKEPVTTGANPATARAPSATAAAAAPIKTIGLVSVVGETFTVRKIGMTVFGNEEHKFPVAAWKIDDRVAKTVGRVLKKNFRIKRIQIPAGAFAKLHEGTFIFNGREEAQAKFLAQHALPHKSDYYLLVSPGGSQVGSTNQGISGLGVVRWDHILSPGEYVHALSVLTVYDPQMKPLRSEQGSIGQATFMVSVRGPHQELKDGEKLPPDPQAALADPRAQKIAWELLDRSLAQTLPKLFAAN